MWTKISVTAKLSSTTTADSEEDQLGLVPANSVELCWGIFADNLNFEYSCYVLFNTASVTS